MEHPDTLRAMGNLAVTLHALGRDKDAQDLFVTAPLALQYAWPALRADKVFVIGLARQCGNVVQFASESLRADEDVMTEAVSQDPSSAKWAMKPLRPQSLAAQRLRAQAVPTKRRDIVMSVRYAFAQDASAAATECHQYIKGSPRFADFHLYDPNMVSKGFCGWSKRRITDKTWPCRGQCYARQQLKRLITCSLVDLFASTRTSKPNDRSCWRYSFRHHLNKALRSGGFMLQLIEYNAEAGMYQLGAGQEIETEIADALGVKTFRMELTGSFAERHANALASRVNAWLAGGGSDSRLEEIKHMDVL